MIGTSRTPRRRIQPDLGEPVRSSSRLDDSGEVPFQIMDLEKLAIPGWTSFEPGRVLIIMSGNIKWKWRNDIKGNGLRLRGGRRRITSIT